jgi:probable F420-dependent oxidoreductase
MKFGIGLPQAINHVSAASVKLVAQEAEKMGLEAVWVLERLIRPTHPLQPYGGVMDPWPESFKCIYNPIETLTFAAAVTERVKLGTSVIDALYHPPVVLGKRLATLDQLSGGRLIAGLGQGWSDDEFGVVNVPPRRKGAGVDEYLHALLAVWGPDPVQFSGRFYTIPESEIGPKPAQQPRPTVLLAGFVPAAIERAAKLRFGFNPVVMNFDWLAGWLQMFRAAEAAAGHAAGSLPIMARANAELTTETVTAPDRMAFVGTVEQAIDDAKRVADMGVDHLFIDFYIITMRPEEKLQYVEKIKTAVG